MSKTDIKGLEAIERKFAGLEREVKNGMLLRCLQKGANVLRQNTISEMERTQGMDATSTSEKWGRPMTKGVTVRTDRAYSEVRISIRGDARNVWFELGTKDRYLRRTGAKDRERGRVRGDRRFLYRKEGKEHLYRAREYRGRITPKGFFASARANMAPVTAAIEKEFERQIESTGL